MIRYFSGFLACAAFAAAAVWSGLLGWADHYARQETVEGTEKAISLMPGQSLYRLRLAILLSDSNAKKAEESLRQAVALNPSDSASWIELGLIAESAGDYVNAEKCLLRAAETDKQYLPAWTLANYYFRRNEETKFWLWAKAAAAMLYTAPTPLFRLCGQVVEDGNLLDRLDIRNPDTQASYLAYLLGEGRPDLIGPSTRRLLARGRAVDTPILLSACNRLIDAKAVDAALEIWNSLAKARRIPAPPVAAGEGTMPLEFTATPTSQGFDWRLPVIDGVSASSEEPPPGLRFTFSGSQPQNCELLIRFLPVREDAAYELAVLYRTAGIPPQTGLGWRITDAYTGRLLTEPDSLSSEKETQSRTGFVAPAGCRLVRITLTYRRTLGTTRIEGSILLRSAELTSKQPAQ